MKDPIIIGLMITTTFSITLNFIFDYDRSVFKKMAIERNVASYNSSGQFVWKEK